MAIATDYDPSRAYKMPFTLPSQGSVFAPFARMQQTDMSRSQTPSRQFQSFDVDGVKIPAAPAVQPAPISTAAPEVQQAVAAAPAPNPYGQSVALAGTGSEEFAGDPILAQIRRLNASDLAMAENQALAGRRELALGLGSRKFAEQYLGGEDPILGAISDDPDKSTSVLARIARGYRDTLEGAEDQMNKHNLFYGGARAKTLKRLADDRTLQEDEAVGSAQQALAEIGRQLLSAKNAARDRELAAMESAFARFLAAAANRRGTSTTSTAPAASQSGEPDVSGGVSVLTRPEDMVHAMGTDYQGGRYINGVWQPYVGSTQGGWHLT